MKIEPLDRSWIERRCLALRSATFGPTMRVALVLVMSACTPQPSVLASPSTVPSPAVTASATQSPTRAPSRVPESPSPAPAVRPDPQHGVIVATGGLRTEDADRSLQTPSLFATAPTTSYAVSPDGKRVALIRTTQTGQQIVTFTTARPNDITTVADLSGTGERANHIIWAGDGSDGVLFEANREARGPGGGDNLIIEYSALRSVDLPTRAIREIVRISGQNNSLWALAWLPSRQLAGALEVQPLGPTLNYVLIRAGAIERTPLNPRPSVASFNASRDGTRVLMFVDIFIRWWPVDQPATARDLVANSGEKLGRAALRPGADEIGVDVGPAFEIWTLTGQRRVVGKTFGGFRLWRVDGTAAIVSSDPSSVGLLDPVTGTITPLSGGGFPVADVVMF